MEDNSAPNRIFDRLQCWRKVYHELWGVVLAKALQEHNQKREAWLTTESLFGQSLPPHLRGIGIAFFSHGRRWSLECCSELLVHLAWSYATRKYLEQQICDTSQQLASVESGPRRRSPHELFRTTSRWDASWTRLSINTSKWLGTNILWSYSSYHTRNSEHTQHSNHPVYPRTVVWKEKRAFASLGFDEKVCVIAVEDRSRENHWHGENNWRRPVNEEGRTSKKGGWRKELNLVKCKQRSSENCEIEQNIQAKQCDCEMAVRRHGQ